MKCFSFTTFNIIRNYEVIIVPLLRRMINLEELQLYLTVERTNSTYIDGIQLYDQFLIYMVQLNKFTFNIKTEVFNGNINIDLPSNKDIQRSFIGRSYGQVASYVNADAIMSDGECHVYSLPYDFEFFFDLDNSFQGGVFSKVRQLTMKDEIRLKHKTFQLISHDFPVLEYLYIFNTRRMKHKRHSFPLITFPSLIYLDLEFAHTDYALLLLLKRNARLPRLVNLRIANDSLIKIKNNFTYDAINFNFDKLKP